jgi:hypothetical protein
MKKEREIQKKREMRRKEDRKKLSCAKAHAARAAKKAINDKSDERASNKASN